MDYRIFPPEELIDVTIDLPISKSVANRALIMKALSGEGIDQMEFAHCDDGEAMYNALCNDNKETCINIGAAGTAMRFLTAFYASKPNIIIELDGSERMRERPIKELVDALRSLGAKIEYMGEEGFPPIKIIGSQLHGGNLTLRADISSQYISAILMIAPTMTEGLNLVLTGQIVSKPYIDMTIKMMRRRGINIEMDGNTIVVEKGNYKPVNEPLELDWTAASYWAEIVALSAGFVNLPGLSLDSIQGDRKMIDLFSQLGVRIERNEEDNNVTEFSGDPEVFSHLNIDLSQNPDLAQTIAVTSAMLRIPFHLSGLSTLRIKETDRLEALKNELDKMGCKIDIIGNEVIEWDGRTHPIFEIPEIHTYKDHRMAMAFAPAALYIPGLVIKDAEVVTKSYPEFWDHLEKAGFVLTDASLPLSPVDEQ